MMKSALTVVALCVMVGALVACPIGVPAQAVAYQAQCYAPAQTYAPAVTYLAYPVTLQVAIPTVAVPAQQVAPQPVPQQAPVPQAQVQAQVQTQVQQEVVQQYAPAVAAAPVVVRQAVGYYAAPQVALAQSYGYAAAGVGYGHAANVVVQRQVVRQRAVAAPARVVVRQNAVQRRGLLGRLFANRRGVAASRTTVIVR